MLVANFIFCLLAAIAIAAMPLAGHMAAVRHRSAKRWTWATFLAGPLGPLALYLLGNAKARGA